MRIGVLLVALFAIVVGILGIVSPDSVTTVRRLYFSTSVGLYTAGAVRIAMGLLLILFAPRARTPKTPRTLGVVVCAQGLTATVLGPERAQAILEWEAMLHPALLRAGAVVAVATGGFIAFAATKAT